MPRPLVLNPDRLFPADPGVRGLARSLYASVRNLPIISPHGHTDPAWFAYDEPFGDAVDLLLAPDHYLYRMLHSQGVPLDRLGVRTRQGAPVF
jgi:glucuronate isomerase